MRFVYIEDIIWNVTNISVNIFRECSFASSHKISVWTLSSDVVSLTFISNLTFFSVSCNRVYYLGTDEIPGFFLLLKNHIFIARSEDTVFIFHVWMYLSQVRFAHSWEILSALEGKIVSPSGHIMFCLFSRYWWNSYIKDNFFSKEPAARLSGKLSCNWLIMLVTMATSISSHVKDENSIFTARDEDMIF